MKQFDIVIVGSGLGGLLCANILSKEGFSVCVIEKNKQIGGCLQTFNRGGCVFDTGVHYIGSMDEGQVTNRLFKYFGIMDKLNLKRLDENGFDILDLNGTQFKYPIGYDRFIDTMSHQFPREKEEIKEYCKQIMKIIDSLDLFNLRLPQKSGFNPYYSLSIADFMSSVTCNKQLQNVLAGLNFLYAGSSHNTSIYQHATVFHSFLQSSWRPIDGSSQIADFLVESIEENGGVILSDSEVCHFKFSGKNIESVKLNNGEEIHGKQFISNVHPAVTLSLIDRENVRALYRERIESISNSISTFCLYVRLKENSFKYQNYNYYHINSDDVWSVLEQKTDDWPGGYMFLTPATSKSEDYADTAIILTFMEYKDVLQWENTSINKRGEEYLDFKRKKAECLLDAVEENIPGFRQQIKQYYTSTPLTYRDYTGTKDGSIYGISKDCKDPFKTHVSVRTKIPNLFFTGQNTSMHGILGVSIGSLQTCAEFIGYERIIDQINKSS
ncbi:NAD(P)/FAD-dependent oxidoreductase [bacterium]|nr:NAD(P)/FAD-dependent oxidoreductase [bacterium]